MAQIPATSKSARFRRRTCAAVLGAEWLLRHDRTLQPSERAALKARQTPPKQPAQQVVFLIPLVGRHHVQDWQGTCTRLTATLTALLRQSNPNWQAVVCGQDRPTSLPDDHRITFLPFDTPVAGNDKWHKLAQLTTYLPHLGVAAGYAMTFDADDIAHPYLVKEMLGNQAAGGYLAETGYVWDQGAATLALAGPRRWSMPLRKPFWKLCGSCAAVRFDLANGTVEIDYLREMSQHEHRMFPYLAQLAGRSLTPLQSPKVLYLLNHGENFGARRGRVSFKTRFVQRYRVKDDAAVRADFGV